MLFSAKQAENHARRELLLMRSRDLRLRLAEDSQVLARPLALVDRIRDGFHWLAAHPQWVALPIAITVVLRPRRVLGWALKAWRGWRMFRRVQGLLPR